MTTTLWGFWRSSATWRVRIALRLKSVAHDYVPVNLLAGEQRGEYAKQNPMAQVPLLAIDGVQLSQSVAIVEYLDETRPDPPLFPRDSILRARVREVVEIVNSGIQPLQNTSVREAIDGLGGAGAGDAWVRRWVTRGLDALERRANQLAGQFTVGDAITAADVFVVPQMGFTRRFDLDPARWPTLAGIEARCSALPAFADARPEAQPDLPKHG